MVYEFAGSWAEFIHQRSTAPSQLSLLEPHIQRKKNILLSRSRFQLVLVTLVLTLLFVIVVYQFVRTEHKPVVLASVDAPSLEENNVVTSSTKRINLPDLTDGPKAKTTKPLVFLKRPSYRLTGKLTDHLATLQEQYSNGDKAAGYTLAANLLRCDRAAVTKEQVER